MMMKKEGIFTIKKEGSFYRVYRKRTRIARFLLLSDAENILIIVKKWRDNQC